MMSEGLNRVTKDNLIEAKMKAQDVATESISLRWQTNDGEIKKLASLACYYALRAADQLSAIEHVDYEKNPTD
jgi:hypothetical protein